MANVNEYYDTLFHVQQSNNFSRAWKTPCSAKMYDVDWNTRIIAAPQFLSVSKDHEAEVVYFKVPRVFDAIDLANLPCVIQYVNALNMGAYYIVPGYDLETYADYIIVPWVISGAATAAAGNIKFSIRFFKVDENKQLVYNLCTQSANSKILYGLDLSEEVLENEHLNASYLDQVASLLKMYADQTDVYWEDLESVRAHSRKTVTPIFEDKVDDIAKMDSTIKSWLKSVGLTDKNYFIIPTTNGDCKVMTEYNGATIYSKINIPTTELELIKILFYKPVSKLTLTSDNTDTIYIPGRTYHITANAVPYETVKWTVPNDLNGNAKDNVYTFIMPSVTENFEISAKLLDGTVIKEIIKVTEEEENIED